MSGKKNQRGSFISNAKLLRQVSAADTSPAAVTELINAGPLNEARNNTLHISVIIPSSVTSYTIAVYSDIVASMPTVTADEKASKALVEANTQPADRWAIVDGLTARDKSSYISLAMFYPAKNIKVLLEDVVGDFSGGDAFILYGISE